MSLKFQHPEAPHLESQTTRKRNWPAILAISAAGLCVLTCMGISLALFLAPRLSQAAARRSSLAVGTAAPDFELAALGGGTVRLSQYRGKPVLLTFGASWCPDCRKEAPIVERLHREHPELVVLLVDSQESPEAVRIFADQMGLTHTILLDRDSSVIKLYRVFAIPTELFIDSDGVIQAKLIEGVTPEVLAENLPSIGVEP